MACVCRTWHLTCVHTLESPLNLIPNTFFLPAFLVVGVCVGATIWRNEDIWHDGYIITSTRNKTFRAAQYMTHRWMEMNKRVSKNNSQPPHSFIAKTFFFVINVQYLENNSQPLHLLKNKKIKRDKTFTHNRRRRRLNWMDIHGQMFWR
jgi:hypothetical protein